MALEFIYEVTVNVLKKKKNHIPGIWNEKIYLIGWNGKCAADGFASISQSQPGRD